MKYLEVLFPIFRIYQLVGFAPFSLPLDAKKGNNNHGELKWNIYNGILLFYLSALVVYNIAFYQTFLDGKPTEMLTYLTYIMFCGMRALAAVTVIESTLKTKQHIIFLEQLASVDDILQEELGIGFNYKKIRRIAFIWMTFWIVQNVLLISFLLWDSNGGQKSPWDAIKWIPFTVPLLMSSIKYYQIIQYIKTLGFCFQIINKRLELIFTNKNRLNTEDKMLMRKIPKTKNNSSNDAIFDEIVTLRRVYHTLWKSTTQLNRTFRWSLLLLIGASFIIIVVNYYRTLVWIITPNKDNILEMFMYLFWSIGHTFYFINLSSVCYVVSQEVRKIPIMLHNLAFKLTDPDVNMLIQDFSLQIFHQQIVFNAFGFFNLDFTFLFSVLGAVTTYLFILVQFALTYNI